MPKQPAKTLELKYGELCPCESGQTYGRCCKTRDFKWERDSRGHIVKSMPIGDELLEHLKEMRSDFVETFGREPGKGDPVLFQQYYISERDRERQSLKAMKAAGSPPSLVYATRKTGRMVTKENQSFLSRGELREWNDAINEYYDRVERGEEFDVFEHEDEFISFLKDGLRKNQIVACCSSRA